MPATASADDDHHPGSAREPQKNSQLTWKDINATKFLLTGCVTASCDLFLFPCDLVKTRMQLLGGPNQVSFPVYKNTFDAFRQIVRTESFFGLYKGLRISICGSIPADITYYTAYEFGKHNMKKYYRKFHKKHPSFPDPANVDPFVHVLMGGLADSCAAIFWIPADVIMQKMMSQGSMKEPKYKSGFDALSTIVKNDGIRGLYRGCSATMVVFACYSSISWGTYEFTRKSLYQKFCPDIKIKDFEEPGDEEDEDDGNDGDDGSQTRSSGNDKKTISLKESAIHCVSGTTAGATGAFLTTPIDVIKTRLQVQDYFSKSRTPGLMPKYASPFAMAAGIFREEGILAFYKGVLPRVMYAAPVATMQFFLYELIKKFASS